MPLEKNTLARILGWVTTRIAWVVSVFELRKYSEMEARNHSPQRHRGKENHNELRAPSHELRAKRSGVARSSPLEAHLCDEISQASTRRRILAPSKRRRTASITATRA